MERIAASTGTAKNVVDYRRTVDGKNNPNYGKEINVEYEIPAFDVVQTEEELHKKFSVEQLINMAQSRQKATANSAARQKAVALYAASGDDLARINFIEAGVKMGLTREQAEALADSTKQPA